MGVNILSPEQYREAIFLSMYAFQTELSEEQREERLRKLDKHTILGIMHGEELAAKLHIIPFQIMLNGESLAMGGIAGVATYPEYRRKGYVQQLMASSLLKMREDGQTVSMLHPFSVGFYRKYGWELFTDFIKATLAKEDLIQVEQPAGSIRRYKKADGLEHLASVYEHFIRNMAGMLIRSTEWWLENTVDDLTYAIYYSEKGKPEGYILYSIENRKMEVEEFTVLSHEARNSLWNFICQHDSMVDVLEMKTRANDPLFFSLRKPNVKAEIIPYTMARIVDAEKFLSAYPFKLKQGSSLLLNIQDDFAGWNSGLYQIDITGARKADSGDINTKETLTMSINSLAALLFGYKTARQLWKIGHIRGNMESAMELAAVIPEQTPYFADFF